MTAVEDVELGYFDHSHLGREGRRFTGATPKALRPRNHLLKGDQLLPLWNFLEYEEEKLL